MDRPVYRGGRDLTPKPKELRIDKNTGLVQPSRGISLNADPGQLVTFGGAYKINSIPADLEIVQYGRNKDHYELRPKLPMLKERYVELLSQVEVEDSPTIA